MSEPRIVPPDEAREVYNRIARSGNWTDWVTHRDLAHTAAVLGEQRQAVLALHKRIGWGEAHEDACCDDDGYEWPCPTARALGVTGDA